jgi:hypothetical protein
VAEYHLLTIWRIEAPLEKVYAAIENSLHWPDWWLGAEKVEQTVAGDSNGINNIRRYSWRGELPYSVIFQVRATRIEKLVAIEGTAHGDLEGVGRWRFSRKGVVSIVHDEWHVRSTKWWMNLAAPLARSIFIRNHTLVMTQGGEGLARLLALPGLRQENIDLMAQRDQPLAVPRRLQERGSVSPMMLLVAGIGAGVIATAAQLALWWLAGTPVFETLYRDARLTAALVMGTEVLPPPSTARWDILWVATFIHFALSIAYALIPALLVGRLRAGPALVAGAAYGLMIYLVNLYGLTVLFPWFVVARDWVTLLTHLVFGMALVTGCRLSAPATRTKRVTSFLDRMKCQCFGR